MQIGNNVLRIAALMMVVGWVQSGRAQEHYSYAPQLFANQYTQGYANQATAQMYVAPVPVPEWVGHTYYTYQALYPHEMMYWHHQRYHSYYDNGRGLNSTRVHYYAPPVRTLLHGITPILPRP